MNTLFGVDKQNDVELKYRQARKFLRALIDVELPTSSGGEHAIYCNEVCDWCQGRNTDNLGIDRSRSPHSGTSDVTNGLTDQPRPRIVYLKDFGAIAPYAKTLLNELILAVRSRRIALRSSAYSTQPYEVQSTVIVLGVSRSPELSPHSRGEKETWQAFVDGFKTSNHEKLSRLCPKIDRVSISGDTESITNVLGSALLAGAGRVSHADSTPDAAGKGFRQFCKMLGISSDTESSTSTSSDNESTPSDGSDKRRIAIYRRIIGVHGFFDSRDSPLKLEQGGVGGQRPDLDLWRKGKARAQKERKEELASACFAANERILCEALAYCGGKLQESFGVFSALPEGDPIADGAMGSDRLERKTDELEMEKYATLSGLRFHELPKTLAKSIATLALCGLSPKSGAYESAVSKTSLSNSAFLPSSPPSTKVEERIISPEDIAAAIRAGISATHQLDQWLDDYEKLKKGNRRNAGNENNEDKKEDPVIARVRSKGNLNSHEETLLQCVVTPVSCP